MLRLRVSFSQQKVKFMIGRYSALQMHFDVLLLGAMCFIVIKRFVRAESRQEQFDGNFIGCTTRQVVSTPMIIHCIQLRQRRWVITTIYYQYYPIKGRDLLTVKAVLSACITLPNNRKQCKIMEVKFISYLQQQINRLWQQLTCSQYSQRMSPAQLAQVLGTITYYCLTLTQICLPNLSSRHRSLFSCLHEAHSKQYNKQICHISDRSHQWPSEPSENENADIQNKATLSCLPKKPLSSFLLYVEQQKKILRQKDPGSKVSRLEMAQRWKEMSKEETQVYRQKHQELTKDYLKQRELRGVRYKDRFDRRGSFKTNNKVKKRKLAPISTHLQPLDTVLPDDFPSEVPGFNNGVQPENQNTLNQVLPQ